MILSNELCYKIDSLK